MEFFNSFHLIFGWPAYLLTGSTGGIKYGTSNHFWPIKPFSKYYSHLYGAESWISDIGVALTIMGGGLLLSKFGLFPVIAMYIGPLLVVNSWLVVYTWLHHTDSCSTSFK